ncbi:MAG TPA: methyltransferase domain-containing protein [Vicinamibacterales bacterium]|nr:methyltransferase domain-containing protein [Vicinamibacterales bacterium]
MPQLGISHIRRTTRTTIGSATHTTTTHCQRAGNAINIPDGYFDAISSNGSFDHMRQSERIDAFLEIERCLRPGGILCFGCEYFDYDSPDMFLRLQRDPDIVARNCMAFDNINLREICDRLTRLTLCQRDLSKIPAGEPLRDLVSPEETEFYSQVSTSGQLATWGAFFAVFVKR